MNVWSQFIRTRPSILTLIAAVTCAPSAGARPKIGELPTIWPLAKEVRVVREAAMERLMTADETWDATSMRNQILDTDGATRTITMASIGPDSIPAGTTFVVRVTTHGDERILFRRADGELIAFWGADSSNPTQWAVLKATAEGWRVRVSPGQQVAGDDGRFAQLGAALRQKDGYMVPDSKRAEGYSLRFESDAPRFFVVCGAHHPRFRVLVNGKVAAEVEVPDDSGQRLRIPIELASSAKKRVEILADSLEFAGLEIPDTHGDIDVWQGAVPAIRMLWLGDGSAESGTRGYPWMLARLVDFDVWNRPWGYDAEHVAALKRNVIPEDAIRDDVEATNPDVIVVSGDFFDDQLPRREYEAVVNAWFDAIDATTREDTIKIVLPAWVDHGPVDKATAKCESIVHKAAKRHRFQYINWQDWIDGDPDDATEGIAHTIVAPDHQHFTPTGHAYIAARFADEIRDLEVERKAQTAAMRRHQSEFTVGNIATTVGEP